MRLVTIGLVGLAVAVELTGCNLLRSEVAPRAAKIVNEYCELSLDKRLAIRAEVAEATAPNQIFISCKGDQK
jgi:hypothetical protein